MNLNKNQYHVVFSYRATQAETFTLSGKSGSRFYLLLATKHTMVAAAYTAAYILYTPNGNWNNTAPIKIEDSQGLISSISGGSVTLSQAVDIVLKCLGGYNDYPS